MCLKDTHHKYNKSLFILLSPGDKSVVKLKKNTYSTFKTVPGVRRSSICGRAPATMRFGKQVTLWRLTPLSHWSRAKLRLACTLYADGQTVLKQYDPDFYSVDIKFPNFKQKI